MPVETAGKASGERVASTAGVPGSGVEVSTCAEAGAGQDIHKSAIKISQSETRGRI